MTEYALDKEAIDWAKQQLERLKSVHRPTLPALEAHEEEALYHALMDGFKAGHYFAITGKCYPSK